jgi:hypothetical protein
LPICHVFALVFLLSVFWNFGFSHHVFLLLLVFWVFGFCLLHWVLGFLCYSGFFFACIEYLVFNFYQVHLVWNSLWSLTMYVFF